RNRPLPQLVRSTQNADRNLTAVRNKEFFESYHVDVLGKGRLQDVQPVAQAVRDAGDCTAIRKHSS
ncbi:hypothetical protein QCN27_20025, partial [Cereibacter sp. SYSU M97828]|nr:hypothetical protein [Cereibacter flavus]